jgi:hypothetical protein
MNLVFPFLFIRNITAKIQVEGCEMSAKSIDFLTFHVSMSQFKNQLWSPLYQKIERKTRFNLTGRNPFKQTSTLIRTVLITQHTKEGFSTVEFSFENLTQFSTQFQK